MITNDRVNWKGWVFIVVALALVAWIVYSAQARRLNTVNAVPSSSQEVLTSAPQQTEEASPVVDEPMVDAEVEAQTN